MPRSFPPPEPRPNPRPSSSARQPRAGPPIGLGIPKARRSPGSAVTAFLVHLLILFALIRLTNPDYDFQDSSGDPSDVRKGGGGGGGGRVQSIALPALAAAVVPPRPPTPPPVVPPPPVPVPVPEVKPPETPPTPVLVDSARTGATQPSGAGTGTGTGSGSGSGTGTGSGTGSGNGSGNGSGTGPGSGGTGGARPPEPRQLILPPSEIPSNLRGVTISVTFMVDPQGRVDAVRFSPEPDNRGFAKKLDEVMRSYRFRPARSPDGLPVAGMVVVQLTF